MLKFVEYYMLGLDYLHGDHGQVQNDEQARHFFEMAYHEFEMAAGEVSSCQLIKRAFLSSISLTLFAPFIGAHNAAVVAMSISSSGGSDDEKGYRLMFKQLCFQLGVLHRDARGGPRDIAIAVSFFERSSLPESKAAIEAIFNDLYTTQAEGSASASFNLGVLHENGHHVAKNLEMAGGFYREALERGHDEVAIQNAHDGLLAKASAKLNRRLERKFEKSLVVSRAAEHPDPDADYIYRVDVENKTVLHRAAKYKQLKNCARFVLFVPDVKSIGIDAEGKRPFAYLSADEQLKVSNLQNRLAALSEKLNPTEDSLVEKLASKVIMQRGDHNVKESKRTFRDLYQLDDIKPLLDLVYLAMLGLHDGSKRKKLIDPDYDSDNDDEETISEAQILEIRVDARSPRVEGIYHYGADGLEGKGWLGVFAHTNTVYVGGACALDELRGTMIHELTHFIAHEVFKNGCKPYHQDDAVNREQFAAIARDLDGRSGLDPILQGAYMKGYKEGDQVHDELIVRVAQMIVRYPDGLLRVQHQARELFTYYQTVFLPEVVAHTMRLRERALSDWPQELFTRHYLPDAHHVEMAPSPRR